MRLEISLHLYFSAQNPETCNVTTYSKVFLQNILTLLRRTITQGKPHFVKPYGQFPGQCFQTQSRIKLHSRGIFYCEKTASNLCPGHITQRNYSLFLTENEHDELFVYFIAVKSMALFQILQSCLAVCQYIL